MELSRAAKKVAAPFFAARTRLRRKMSRQRRPTDAPMNDAAQTATNIHLSFTALVYPQSMID
jgi:hypothetical protein